MKQMQVAIKLSSFTAFLPTLKPVHNFKLHNYAKPLQMACLATSQVSLTLFTQSHIATGSLFIGLLGEV